MPKPPVESTLEGVLKKLQEKRDEVSRPEDIKVRQRLGAVDCGIQLIQNLVPNSVSLQFSHTNRQVMFKNSF